MGVARRCSKQTIKEILYAPLGLAALLLLKGMIKAARHFGNQLSAQSDQVLSSWVSIVNG